MGKTRSLLAFLFLLLPLLAGCVGVSPAPTEETQGATTTNVAQSSPPASADCDRVTSNPVVWVQTGGLYVVPSPEGPRVAYRESNGVNGLQTEESCPADPDQKLA